MVFSEERVPANIFLERTRITMTDSQMKAWKAEERKKIRDIELNDIDKLRKVIANGVDVNNIFLGGRPILQAAAMSKENHIEFVKLLLKAGAYLNKGSYSQQPLWWAEQFQKRELIKLLLEAGAKVTMRHAIKKGYTKKAVEMLNTGTDPNGFDDGGRSFLQLAESERRREIALLLVGAGATTSLAHAVSQSYTNRVIQMLDSGSDPDEGSPLAVAVSKGQLDMVILLLNAGASVEDDGSNLINAVQNNKPNIVTLLLVAGAKFNFDIPKGKIKQTVVLKFNSLLGLNAVPRNEKQAEEYTIANSDELSLLHLAAIRGYTEIVSQLIYVGSDIDKSTKNGFTPLHCAALFGHTESVSMLLKAEANTSPKVLFQGDHHSALELAQLKNHPKIVELIEESNSFIGSLIKTVTNLF